MIDWYENRHQLRVGMEFITISGRKVRLDRTVPGDATQWYADIWSDHSKRWMAEDFTIEPGDLAERLDA